LIETKPHAAGIAAWNQLVYGVMNDQPKLALTRETILSGEIHDLIKNHDSAFELLSDAERAASLNAMFEDGPIHEDVWLFAYGSLI
jgi:hypothetical protein